jgi:DNA-binding protein Fis
LKKSDIASAIEMALDNFFLIQKNSSNVVGLYGIVVQEVERILIKKVMQLTDRNKKKTAKILGISRNTLDSKIKNLNIYDEQNF